MILVIVVEISVALIVIVVGALERVRVVRVDIVAAEIDLRLEFEALAEQPPHPQTRKEQVVARAVGMREHLGAIEFEQLDRRYTIADQFVVRNAQRELHVPTLAALRELQERLPQRTGREIAPAILLVGPRGHEPTETVLRAEDAAGTQLARPAPERSALQGQA